MVQTQFNLPIKALRSYHGGEYTSTTFSTYLLHHGIHHQFSCPHTPKQNGIAERKDRHLLQTARILLHHASLPPPFWLEAASTATYLINRLPTKSLNMESPYHKLYRQSPSYLHLKIFGCLCYPWTAYTQQNKLDPKSSPCIFIGYSLDHKGYRCFDPHTSKLIISRHVRFHEHEFPMALHPSTLTPPQISTIHNPLPPLLLPTFHPQPHPLPSHPTGHPPRHHTLHPLLPAIPIPTSNTNDADLPPPPFFHPPHLPHPLSPSFPLSLHHIITP